MKRIKCNEVPAIMEPKVYIKAQLVNGEAPEGVYVSMNHGEDFHVVVIKNSIVTVALFLDHERLIPCSPTSLKYVKTDKVFVCDIVGGVK